jgi:hypothetical protein
LLAALLSALSYLVSRHHVLAHPELQGRAGGLRLIVQSHGLMGLASIPLCLALWPHSGGPPAYAACGALHLPAAPRMWPRSPGGWTPAVHYSVVWLLAMTALYACLGQVGAVFGNILQSTRGVMSVVLGAALAHAGWHDVAGTKMRSRSTGPPCSSGSPPPC